ncbi:MAG: biotin transporter BioY, partial [Gaiellales bacterium]
MLVGSVCLYATGLVWLHQAIPTSWTGAGATTLHYGLWPFVVGDIAKILAAAAIIDPAAPWGRVLGRLQDG